MSHCVIWKRTYRKENHYCQAVLQSEGQVLCLVASVCSLHLDNGPLMLFQHVQALQSLQAAPVQVQNPTEGKREYNEKIIQNNERSKYII